MTKVILGMVAFFALVALMAWAFGFTGGPQ
jgi:hypothetical protein